MVEASLEDYSVEEIEEFGPKGLLDDGYKPIEGYDIKDVGWIRVDFCDAGLPGFVAMGENGTWMTTMCVLREFASTSQGSILDECHPDARNEKDQIYRSAMNAPRKALLESQPSEDDHELSPQIHATIHSTI